MRSQASKPCDEENTLGINTLQEKFGDYISLPRTPSNLDEEQIFAEATDYKKWTFNRFAVHDSPPFDNSVVFGITADDENTHLREEIRKLVRFVNAEKPHLFDSCGAFGGTDPDGFEDLYNVVDQILCNLEVIRHDNACVSLDHHLDEDTYAVFHASRSALRQRYLDKQGRITGHNPRLLSDEQRNMQAYHALVDFTFHSLAWWLMHVAEKKSWHTPIIAVLARWSVKLKLIALDPKRWAELALVRGEEIMKRSLMEQKSEDRIVLKLPAKGPEAEWQAINFPDDMDIDSYYFSSKLQFRESLNKFVRRMLGNLIAETSNAKSAAFEVHTFICKSGLDESLRLLTCQRDRTIEASSNLADLGRSHRALQLLLSNVQSIAQTTQADAPTSEMTDIRWRIGQDSSPGAESGSVMTRQLDDLVSALVPLTLIGISHMVKTLDSFVFRLDEEEIPAGILERSPDKFPSMEFSLIAGRGRVKTAGGIKPMMIPLLQSPLMATIGDINKELVDFDVAGTSSDEVNLRRNAERVLGDYKSRKAEIESWRVTEDSIRVRTTKYSTIVLTVAIAFIGGGLCVPFLVGEGIPGVDPFQFVTFGWLLAGAFLVGAKSRYVENWPWHDFLRGQIVCRSVSELAVASRVKEQAILLYLLHHQFRNPLTFRGPYHGIFHGQEQSGTDGFSIDVKASHATVLVSGFIVFEAARLVKDKREIHTVLQDTRDDSPAGITGQALVFKPVEDLGGRKVKQQLKYDITVPLKPNEFSSLILPQYEVIGLPTAECSFI